MPNSKNRVNPGTKAMRKRVQWLINNTSLKVSRAGSFVRAVLAQLADEPAYHSFLQRHSTAPSPQSWAAFVLERHSSAASPRRCC